MTCVCFYLSHAHDILNHAHKFLSRTHKFLSRTHKFLSQAHKKLYCAHNIISQSENTKYINVVGNWLRVETFLFYYILLCAFTISFIFNFSCIFGQQCNSHAVRFTYQT